MQSILKDGVEEARPSDLQDVFGDASTSSKNRQVHRNPLLHHSRSMPGSGQSPAADIDPEAASASAQSQGKAQSESTVSAGLGAKLQAQLAALKAEAQQESQQELEMTGVSQDQPASRQGAGAQHQTPLSGRLVSPPDSIEGDAAADTASEPGGALGSEQTWTAGMGQDLGKQLQARLAGGSKAPSTARPPLHQPRPSSEQTWSAGQGASLGSQLKQQLAHLRSAGSNDLAQVAAEGSQQPAGAGPRDADRFPAKPTRVPWTATMPESSEQTWTDSLGRRIRQQMTAIRGLGSDTSVPPPRKEQRPSLFDLFSDQPMSERPTWSAGVGEKMRRQLEEARKREIEDSACTTSSPSQDQESARSTEAFTTHSLPSNTLPASEQTWTAGMGHAARKELLQRRSVIKRNLSSPDVPDDYGKERQSSASMSQSAKDESSRGGKDFLQHDSLDFHHLEEIPHVRIIAHHQHKQLHLHFGPSLCQVSSGCILVHGLAMYTLMATMCIMTSLQMQCASAIT